MGIFHTKSEPDFIYINGNDDYVLSEVLQQKESCGFAALAAFFPQGQELHDALCTQYPNISEGISDTELTALLEMHGFSFNISYSQAIMYGRIYIAAVPSLANRQGSHYIVIDGRKATEPSEFVILDSNKNYEGRQAYTELPGIWATTFEILGRYEVM